MSRRDVSYEAKQTLDVVRSFSVSKISLVLNVNIINLTKAATTDRQHEYENWIIRIVFIQKEMMRKRDNFRELSTGFIRRRLALHLLQNVNVDSSMPDEYFDSALDTKIMAVRRSCRNFETRPTDEMIVECLIRCGFHVDDAIEMLERDPPILVRRKKKRIFSNRILFSFSRSKQWNVLRMQLARSTMLFRISERVGTISNELRRSVRRTPDCRTRTFVEKRKFFRSEKDFLQRWNRFNYLVERIIILRKIPEHSLDDWSKFSVSNNFHGFRVFFSIFDCSENVSLDFRWIEQFWTRSDRATDWSVVSKIVWIASGRNWQFRFIEFEIFVFDATRWKFLWANDEHFIGFVSHLWRKFSSSSNGDDVFLQPFVLSRLYQKLLSSNSSEHW